MEGTMKTAVMLGIGLPLVKYRIRRAREMLAAYISGDM